MCLLPFSMIPLPFFSVELKTQRLKHTHYDSFVTSSNYTVKTKEGTSKFSILSVMQALLLLGPGLENMVERGSEQERGKGVEQILEREI